MSKLNQTQIAVLSAAANRRDHLLVPPGGLSGRSAKAPATTLMKLGLAVEVEVKRKQPAWPTGEVGTRISLALTEAGLTPVRVQQGAKATEAPGPQMTEPAHSGAGSPEPRAQEEAPSTDAGSRAPADSPRGGTKQSLVLRLLRRPSGASLDELVAATRWLPHTTRAALTGLRQRGFAIDRRKGEDGRSAYFLPHAEESLTSEAA